VFDPGTADFVRDTLSAIAGGLAVLGIGGWWTGRRNLRRIADAHAARHNRLAETVWHLLERTGTEPIYPRSEL